MREEGLSDKELKDKYSAIDIISAWVDYYNNERLHASLHYLRPVDYLNGNQEELLKERREKLKRAAKTRRQENLKHYMKDVKEQKEGALPLEPQDLPHLAVPA